MSRICMSDDYDSQSELWAMIRFAGAVQSAIRGRRGQAFLRRLRDTLDAMPEKALGADYLESPNGQFCTLGAEMKARNLPIHPGMEEDHDQVAAALDIAPSLATEVVYRNDEGGLFGETPEGRWKRMRQWVDAQIQEAVA